MLEPDAVAGLPAEAVTCVATRGKSISAIRWTNSRCVLHRRALSKRPRLRIVGSRLLRIHSLAGPRTRPVARLSGVGKSQDESVAPRSFPVARGDFGGR